MKTAPFRIPRFPAAPRDVVRRKGIPVPVRIVLFMLIPHVWVGLGMAWVVVRAPVLQLLGHDSTATVTGHEIGKSKGTRYYVRYAYDDGGRRYSDRSQVEERAFKTGLPVGSTVSVRSFHLFGYGPSKLRSPGATGETIGCMLPFVMIWDGMLSLMFYGMCLAVLGQRRMLRDGEVAPGHVVGKEEHKGKSTTYSVLYTFTTPEGLLHRGSATVEKAEYAWAMPGDPLIVFYDPNYPQHSLLYKYSQYAVRDEHGFTIGACPASSKVSS